MPSLGRDTPPEISHQPGFPTPYHINGFYRVLSYSRFPLLRQTVKLQKRCTILENDTARTLRAPSEL